MRTKIARIVPPRGRWKKTSETLTAITELDPLRKTVSSRLREARERREWTQTELADHTGLLPSAISHFESGRRLPSCSNLVRLADILRVKVDFILGRTQ